MKTTHLSVPEVGLIAITLAILGVGIGLLIRDRFSAEQRLPLGWTCLAIGLLTTVPLAAQVFGKVKNEGESGGISALSLW